MDRNERRLIAVRLEAEQIQKLEKLVDMTGWNQSEIVRLLIDAAWVTPPAVGTSLRVKDGNGQREAAGFFDLRELRAEE